MIMVMDVDWMDGDIILLLKAESIVEGWEIVAI